MNKLSTPLTPDGVIDGASSGLQDDLMQIAVTGLGIGAVVFAVRKGWKLLKGFVG